MSFRFRVLLLVGLVAVTATAATAWITLRQASAQLTQSAAADKVQIEAVRTTLTAYGREHGTWEGVPDTVLTLSSRFGQRLHLATDSGIVIADTDQLRRRTARPLGDTTVFVDPRPTLKPPSDPNLAADTTVKEIMQYRSGVVLTACLSRNGFRALITDGPYGIPRFAMDPSDYPWPEGSEADGAAVDREPAAARTPMGGPFESEAGSAAESRPHPGTATETVTGTPADCAARAEATSQDVANIESAAKRCQIQEQHAPACLRQLFVDQVSDVAPVPLRVYFGARGTPTLQTGPVLAAAALVAVFAIVGTTLISRRVLRPIGRLTAASRRLGQGDLTDRVPVAGSDELAELARSFNRMADSLQRGEENQRRLIADVAHELRTPLANLRGYLEALKDGVITPEPELFASLHEEAVLQQRIVDDLQDLALAEAGTLAYHRTAVDLRELVETCRTAHHAVAEAAGVTLAVEDGLAVVVHADPDRLRQVLGNLVSNALRATPAGGEVRLSASRTGTTAVLRVTDTGTGIPADSLPYVFDRFWRADSARNRRTGGSGLGLAIARQIVTDHDGGISVSSTVGQGTTFVIKLPTGTPENGMRKAGPGG